MEHIAPLSVKLIEQLDTIYPKVLPTPGVNREVELYAAGQRSVVDFLLQLQKESEHYDPV